MRLAGRRRDGRRDLRRDDCGIDGQQLFGAEALDDYALEFVVDHVDRVHFLGSVELDDASADFLGVAEFDVERDVQEFADEIVVALAEDVAAFAAYGEDLDFLRGVITEEMQGVADDIGVEGTSQAAIAGEQDDENFLLGAALEERMSGGIFHAGYRGAQDAENFAGVRARGGDAFLRFAEAGGGDEFHGAGDLLRVFHAADAAAEVD